MGELTHFNEQGRAKMVDVTDKAVTHRTAVAAGEIHMALAAPRQSRFGAYAYGCDCGFGGYVHARDCR